MSSTIITIRVTTREKEILKQAAEAKRMSLSEYIRDIIGIKIERTIRI